MMVHPRHDNGKQLETWRSRRGETSRKLPRESTNLEVYNHNVLIRRYDLISITIERSPFRISSSLYWIKWIRSASSPFALLCGFYPCYLLPPDSSLSLSPFPRRCSIMVAANSGEHWPSIPQHPVDYFAAYRIREFRRDGARTVGKGRGGRSDRL